MNETFYQDFSHLRMEKKWSFSTEVEVLFGKCEELIRVISNAPMLPEDLRHLKFVSLTKGIQATTAIEGNTLTEEEIKQIFDRKPISKNKEYQAKEITNFVDALNHLVDDIVINDETYLIDSKLIRKFHRQIGDGLGDEFKAIPGQYAQSQRIIYPYKCPDSYYVEQLIDEFTQWLKIEFNYPQKKDFKTVFTQAVVTHVFFEWIHPFDDGNGRTGRLLEFYILLRGGIPDIAAHILSNFYNDTRSNYYEGLNNARLNKDLSKFIEYALIGFYNGLLEKSETIIQSQKRVVWEKFVYERFSNFKGYKNVRNRKRTLLINIGLNTVFDEYNLKDFDTKIAAAYGQVGQRAIQNDIKDLLLNEFLIKTPDGFFKINAELLKTYLPKKK